MDQYLTKKNLMIGGAVLVVVIIIIVVVVKMKKEKFVLNGSGFMPASGTAPTPMAPLTYLTADASGNLSTTADGSFANISATGGVFLNGYPGNVGDVIVSNGPTTPPVWAAGVGLSDFKSSVALNGYQILPGGLIIQWGGQGSFGSAVLVDFPIPFPNAVFSFTATPTLGAAGVTTLSGNNIFMTSNVTQTSFSFDAPYSMAVYWMAIGN